MISCFRISDISMTKQFNSGQQVFNKLLSLKHLLYNHQNQKIVKQFICGKDETFRHKFENVEDHLLIDDFEE